MKTLLKKATVAASLSAMMVVSLAACGSKKTECAYCQETKTCHEYVATYDGEKETAWFCDDCAKLAKSAMELLGGTFKKK